MFTTRKRHTHNVHKKKETATLRQARITEDK